MNKIIESIKNTFNTCLAKEAELDKARSEVAAMAQSVSDREKKVAEIESAQALLKEAEAIRHENAKEMAHLDEEKVKFENLMREERQAIANEAGRLAPLQDKEKELFAAQTNLYEREAALKIEKKEFATRYIEKIKAHFANTGKAPDVNDIT